MKHVIKWHRYFGLLIAFFVVLLATTGILLNHTEELELSRQKISNPLLLMLYGIPGPEVVAVFTTPNHRLVVGKQTVMLDNHPIAAAPPVNGLVEANGMLILANNEGIILLTSNGELIDSITTSSPVERIGLTGNRVVVDSGDTNHLLDEEMTQLLPPQSPQAAAPDWSTPIALTKAQHDQAKNQLPRNSLPLERVILDLHSGRLFGYAGVIVFDLIAIAMVVLSITGLWMWLWRNRRRSVRKRTSWQ